jgi:hypothetical protein
MVEIPCTMTFLCRCLDFDIVLVLQDVTIRENRVKSMTELLCIISCNFM